MYSRGDRSCATALARAGPLLACAGMGLIVSSGCSGQSSILTGGPTIGQLKTNLSHLEYENDQLKRQLAKLERENRSLDDRLVQERLDNGDLAARLDDARNLLRERGLSPDARLGSHRGDSEARRPLPDADDDTGSASAPAAQPVRKRRKTPFARIPGPVHDLPPVRDDKTTHPESRSGQDDQAGARAGSSLERSVRTTPGSWLPIAAGSGFSDSEVR
jgi:hypothetical protein